MIGRLVHLVVGTWPGRYVTVSALSMVVNLGLTIGLHEVGGIGVEVSFPIALVTVFVLNFLGMRFYVYTDSRVGWRQQLAGYGAATVGFRSTEYLAFLVLHTWLELPYRPVLVGVLLGSYVAKQVVHRWLVFRPPGAPERTDSSAVSP